MKQLITLLFLFIAQLAAAQKLEQRIAKAYEHFEKDEQMRYAISSLTVLNTETGQVVFSKNSDIGLASASTLKTVTAATAFHVLGADFTYQTTLSYSGSITDGTLTGDLIITGSGDPTLGSPRYAKTKEQAVLDNWVAAIRKAGIKKINGRIIGDDSLFGTASLPIGWLWQDMGNYYGAGAPSLCWRENQYDLIFNPGKVGEPATLVRTQPAMGYLQIINEVSTGKPGTGDNVYVYSAPYSNLVYLRGTYASDLHKLVSASLPDPAFECAYRLHETLNRVGISVSGQVTTSRRLTGEHITVPLASNTLDMHQSPTLSQMVYWFNQKSINLYGEELIREIAVKQGKPGSTENGAEAVRDFWHERLGIDKNAMNIIDGSGLSPATRITTRAMALILQSAVKEPWFGSYYESLPLYNNMKMKSGSISDVLAYAGYQDNNGAKLCFSFIVNNYNGSTSGIKQKMFRVLDELKR